MGNVSPLQALIHQLAAGVHGVLLSRLLPAFQAVF
jgi:hypothetical protein